MKYGLLTHRTLNVGDDIQSLAALQFLPRVDAFIDRDNMRGYAGGDETLLLMSGWFKYNPDDWPPPPNIKPVFVGFHVHDRGLLDPKYRDYYLKHSPIGCRDTATMERFKALGVPAYYSGCVTLTLRRSYLYEGERDGATHLVDAGAVMLWPTTGPVVSSTHINKEPTLDPERRLEEARERVQTYARAGLVITSRLHCLLPCLSLKTPVIHVGRRDNRFSGLDPAEVDFRANCLARIIAEAVRC